MGGALVALRCRGRSKEGGHAARSLLSWGVMLSSSYSLDTRTARRWLRRGVALAWLAALGGCAALGDEIPVDTDPEQPLAGYAGTAGSGGKAGAAGKAGAGAAGVGGHEPKGYFDLHFSSVQATLPTGPGEVSPPSLKTTLRVDLPEPPAKGPWLATITPRWGQPALFQVTSQDGGLLLSGSTSLTEVSPGSRVTDVWQSFTLEMKGKRLTGKATASGQESLFQQQTGWSGALSGSGEFSPDATNPESKPLTEGNLGVSSGLLPWEPVQVRFSEPLKPNEALGRLTLRSGSSNVAMSWGVSKEGADGSVSGLSGHRQSWDGLGGATSLVLKDGFRDPALNPGVGFEQNFTSVAVPAPKEGHLWGDGQQILWGSAAAISGAECEGKACLTLGPFDLTSCGLVSSGAALRILALPTGSKLKVRFRVLQSLPGSTVAEETPGPALFTVDIARPGKPASSVEAQIGRAHV